MITVAKVRFFHLISKQTGMIILSFIPSVRPLPHILSRVPLSVREFQVCQASYPRQLPVTDILSPGSVFSRRNKAFSTYTTLIAGPIPGKEIDELETHHDVVIFVAFHMKSLPFSQIERGLCFFASCTTHPLADLSVGLSLFFRRMSSRLITGKSRIPDVSI